VFRDGVLDEAEGAEEDDDEGLASITLLIAADRYGALPFVLLSLAGISSASSSSTTSKSPKKQRPTDTATVAASRATDTSQLRLPSGLPVIQGLTCHACGLNVGSKKKLNAHINSAKHAKTTKLALRGIAVPPLSSIPHGNTQNKNRGKSLKPNRNTSLLQSEEKTPPHSNDKPKRAKRGSQQPTAEVTGPFPASNKIKSFNPASTKSTQQTPRKSTKSSRKKSPKSSTTPTSTQSSIPQILASSAVPEAEIIYARKAGEKQKKKRKPKSKKQLTPMV